MKKRYIFIFLYILIVVNITYTNAIDVYKPTMEPGQTDYKHHDGKETQGPETDPEFPKKEEGMEPPHDPSSPLEIPPITELQIVKVDSYDDLYCRMSHSYIRKLLNYFGPNSVTLTSYDSSLSIGWKIPFVKEELSICEEIRKGIETYKFNSLFSNKIITKDARIHLTKLNMLFINKECSMSYLDEYTRQSLLYIINYFSEPSPERSGFPLCDESWFNRVDGEDYLLYPSLHEEGRSINGTCYSTWSFNITNSGNTQLGPVFIPETKDTDESRNRNTNAKISNHFSNPSFKPPIFFPSTGQVIKVTKMENCHPNGNTFSTPLTWHLWKSKSTSVIKEGHGSNVSLSMFSSLKPLGESEDCNRNLVPDSEELSRSNDSKFKECISKHCTDETDPMVVLPQCLSCRSYDIDEDGTPDQCQDCNKNFISDPIEIRENQGLDRNRNGIIDSCESVSSYVTNTDCNFNGRDDGMEIFSNPSLDKDRNRVIDDCETMGICSVDGSCLPSPKLKCEKFMGGLWSKDECYYDKGKGKGNDNNSTDTNDTPTLPSGTDGPNSQPITPVITFIGSCKNTEKECHDNVSQLFCKPPSVWSGEKRCAERRVIDKLEDNENLKHNIDTFEKIMTNNTSQLALFWAITFSVLFFILTTVVAGSMYDLENEEVIPL